MMPDEEECQYVIDTSGLYEIASASGNLKSLYVSALANGQIAVPSCVWQEFRELYEDEAADLESHVANKIRMKKAYYIGAASVADKIGSRFSQGPYDSHTDLFSASICSIENFTLLTTSDEMPKYDEMDCCESQTVAEWAAEQ